jgi:hypothetical protein
LKQIEDQELQKVDEELNKKMVQAYEKAKAERK